MLRFSASVLLFTVAVLWSSANAELSIGKRDTNEETTGVQDESQIPKREINEETSGFKPSYITQVALKMLARMGDDPKNPTLEKKFDEAFEQNWSNPEDLFNHLRDVYNSATGKDLKDIVDFHFSDE